MKFDIITIFPKIFDSYFGESIIKRAQAKGLVKINIHDLRQWTTDNHKSVDDRPYGGGPGMVMMVEPIWKAVTALKRSKIQNKKTRRLVILFSAKGKPFTQADARRFAICDQLILICGRYEGVDERVAEYVADEELSVGNFVLTGGEIPAMIVVDTVSRLIPGVLGKAESLKEESFSFANRKSQIANREGKAIGDKRPSTSFGVKFAISQYLEYPQYTRPEKFKGWKVSKVLLSGNHKEIKKWRKENAKCKSQNEK